MSDENVQEVVINRKHGGFGLSDEAYEWLIEHREWEVTHYDDGNPADPDADLVDREANGGKRFSLGGKYHLVGSRRDEDLRTNPDLVDVVRELGDAANSEHAKLKVVEIPADVEWEIDEYDGMEWVAESHRTWS